MIVMMGRVWPGDVTVMRRENYELKIFTLLGL